MGVCDNKRSVFVIDVSQRSLRKDDICRLYCFLFLISCGHFGCRYSSIFVYLGFPSPRRSHVHLRRVKKD